MEGHPPSNQGHETRDASVRSIVLAGTTLGVAIVLVGLIVYGIFQFLAERPAISATSNPMSTADSQIPPEPRIEEHPAIGMQELNIQEDKILSTYGWTDKKAGVVRIPIDRAMELQLTRGFPTRKEPRSK
jgi:hypothetical protein